MNISSVTVGEFLSQRSNKISVVFLFLSLRAVLREAVAKEFILMLTIISF